MKLKRYINFINESNTVLDVSLMNNNDRKLLQEYMNIINISDYDNLPNNMKKLGKNVDTIILNYLFSPPTEINKMLNNYTIETNLLKFVSMEYYENWQADEVNSSEAINETYYLLRNYLEDFNMVDSADHIIMLTPEEEKALPSSKVVKKYNL